MQIKYITSSPKQPLTIFSIFILLLTFFLPYTNSQSFTPSTYSVTPNYAKSQSSLYSFNFNAITAFTSNFDIRVYFPAQFTITTANNCAFWLNGSPVNTAICTVSTTTN